MWPQLCTSYCGQFGRLERTRHNMPLLSWSLYFVIILIHKIRELNITFEVLQPSFYGSLCLIFLSKKKILEYSLQR